MAVTNRHTLWFHAVSVGEVNICTQLIKTLEPRLPNVKLVVSTTTSTGMAELEKKLPTHVLRVYYPIDTPWGVARAFRVLHPEAVVLVEAEIWPNFLWAAQARRKPVFLVNARLSQRSYLGYRLFSFLFHPLFAGFAGVGCQNDADATRLMELGCPKEAVRVVGNLKFDAAKLSEYPLFVVTQLLERLGVSKTAKILVAGSTHAGEEAILAEVFLRLRQKHPDLFLIIVPRHSERAGEAGADVAKAGLRIVYRKEMTEQTKRKPGSVDCLVVNTTGELKFFYEYADVAFIGKSLSAEGGQNPLEPAALGKPVVFGPNMQNFQPIAAALVAGKGALQVQDKAGLESALDLLFSDAQLREVTGQNALTVVNANLGAIHRTAEMIIELLRGKDVYITEEKRNGN